MSYISPDVPRRIPPYVAQTDLNQPIRLLEGPFRLAAGNREVLLDADLVFRWFPSAEVGFEGVTEGRLFDIETGEWSLIGGEDDSRFWAPVHVVEVTPGAESTRVRGSLNGALIVGESTSDTLRFSLANFPNYLGAAVQYGSDEHPGIVAGRLDLEAGNGVCRVDVIPERAELRKAARRGAGFVITHVGEWVPEAGGVTAEDALEILGLLHFWFGFLRSAWAGPLLSEGLRDGNVVWRHFANPKLAESHEVTTWLPLRRPLDIADAFAGFAFLWRNPEWRGPLQFAISWLVQANATRTALDSKIVMAQIPLEMLAWVRLVETQRVHSRSDFKRLSAAGRIRALLGHLSIPTEIPAYLTDLPAVCDADAFDGPGVITRVRNALVHADANSRETIESLTGQQRLECWQLALQYVELTLLRLCGYNGYYAARGWKGWKGDDEVLVPWHHDG